MTRTWRTWAWVGSFSLAAVAAPQAFSQDAPPSDEPAVEAPAPADATPETPVPAKKPAEAKPALPLPVGPTIVTPAIGVAAPTVVGDYRVGHIHEGGLPHIFHYSTYHPFLDELGAPFRRTVYNGAHAHYYAGYRNVYAPNWHEFYVPRYYAPACYGYDRSGPPYYGYGQTRSSYYGPNANAPQAAGAATTAVPPAPPAGYNPNGFRYTGDPGVFSPYGVGSSAYFGAYGSAGY